jgi:glycosyltransferase involved in cell wall biosynthesis
LIAEALATVNVPWHCWTIIGSGVDEQKLRERVTALGILDKTVFLGMQDSAQVAALLDAHDIALLPSRYESFFLTVYEAAAKGKIVITNDVADIRAYFTGSPSVVVAQGVTPDDYRKAMVYAIEQFGYLQSTVSETADRIKHDYNWSAVAERFLQALR